MAKRGRPPLKPGWADAIFNHIPHDGWLHVWELQARTNLTYGQVEAAIAYLRENFPDFPLVSSPQQGVRFSVDPRDVRAFAKWRVSTAVTILSRCFTGSVAPYLSQLGDHRQEVSVRRQFERTLEDLGDLVSATP